MKVFQQSEILKVSSENSFVSKFSEFFGEN